MKALQKYSGPVEELSPPEQFLLIMSSVPRLNEKIHLLMLMHQFEVRPGCAAGPRRCSGRACLSCCSSTVR